MRHDSGSKKPVGRFKVEDKGLSALATAYPHSPEDFTLSIVDYIEDMYSQGWEFVTSTHDGNGYRYFFKAV